MAKMTPVGRRLYILFLMGLAAAVCAAIYAFSKPKKRSVGDKGYFLVSYISY